jgi:aminopeptidase YwaD
MIGPDRAGRQSAEAALRATRALLEAHPRRIAGTAGCLEAARAVADLLRPHCDRTEEERFSMHPAPLGNAGRVLAVSYAAALPLLVAGGPAAAAALALCVAGLAFGLTYYVFCGTLFDGLFPAAEGRNVVAAIEPSEEPLRQVLLVAHHDGPYVLRFLLRLRPLAGLRLLSAAAAHGALTAWAAAASVRWLLGTGTRLPAGWGAALALAGLAFVAPLFFLVTRQPSPGAGDNLNACSILAQAAEYFSLRKKAGEPLRHTRLVLLSTDGEEAGQRGAIAFAARHRPDLEAVPASVLNVDSVYRLADLAVLTRDRNGSLPLSRALARRVSALAAELGIALRAKPLPPGGGSTDAAAFARQGIEAVSIIGIPTSLLTGRIVYHTPWDTADSIEPAAVEAVLDIAVRFTLSTDREAASAPPPPGTQ